MTFSEDLDLTTSAYHESGHAVMAWLLDGEVVRTTLESEDEDERGNTAVRWWNMEPGERIRRSALTALGGPIAEQIWLGSHAGGDQEDVAARLASWRADWDEVEQALDAEISPPRGPGEEVPADPQRTREQVLQAWIREVHEHLAESSTWELVCRLADQLEAHGTLEAEQVSETLE
ncbi:MAG: hypothetical protein AB8H80_13850 [Planctomycetota bacterium]